MNANKLMAWLNNKSLSYYKEVEYKHKVEKNHSL